jgi:hypothetical protein
MASLAKLEAAAWIIHRSTPWVRAVKIRAWLKSEGVSVSSHAANGVTGSGHARAEHEPYSLQTVLLQTARQARRMNPGKLGSRLHANRQARQAKLPSCWGSRAD